MSNKLLSFFTLCVFFSCQKNAPVQFSTTDLCLANRKLLEVAMEDGFSPPQASRVYVYPHIAFYSTLQAFFPDSLTNLKNAIKHFPDSLKTDSKADPILTSLLSFCMTAKAVVFSEHLMDDLKNEFIQSAEKNNYSKEKISASIQCAEQNSRVIVQWLKKDNYQNTRTLERYTSSKKENEWRETPPDYLQGLEPHWPLLRKFFIDSMPEYSYVKLPDYSDTKSSEFYQIVNDVYLKSQNLTSDEKNIAMFWDDNPNVSSHHAHLSHITHKISPPGHWLNIVSQICKQQNLPITKATKAFTYSALAMYDGVIDCWRLKYQTKIIRPISFIQKHMHADWKPLIQTPPFPEFTSGHSVVSAAAAEVLSHEFGSNFSFVDSTEILFGHPLRSFNNFHDAAMEVSLSRYYGGIHFKHSVLEGNKQGTYIAQYLLQKLNKK